MDKKQAILIILFIISGVFYYNLTEEINPQSYEAKITRVIDGDTLETENGNKIRLRGINTPEKDNLFYLDAKDFLEGIVLNQTVQVEDFGRDKYGRTLAHVFLNNQNINELILEEGLASLYYYEKDSYFEDLKDAEEFARANEKGIWKKSPDYNCLELIQLKYKEEPVRCTGDEFLEIKNYCGKDIDTIIKDDATHIYKETILANSNFRKEFSCIWNDDGDSLYVFDGQGLLIFYRY